MDGMGTKRWALAALCPAAYMLMVDVTIVQVALPSMQRRLGGELSGLQWTVDAYALPLSALVITFGPIADRWGRRKIFVAGVAAFMVASLLCGLAPGLGALYAARAVQGVAGAAMFTTTLALVGQEFPGRARQAAMAAWGSAVGLGVASGPLVGGLLIQIADWRWIFLVNLPVGALVIALSVRLGEGRDPVRRPLDLPGLAALSGGLGLLTAGLLRGSAADWNGWFGPGCVAAGMILLALFAGLQRRERSMLDASLFRSPAFAGVSGAMLALGAGMFSMMLYLTVYLQNVLGYSALQGGLRLLPVTAPVFLVPLLARRLGVPLVSGRVIAAGLALVAAGLIAMTAAGADTSWLRIAPGMVMAGVGIGLANPALAATGLAVVPPTRAGMAAGISNTCRLAGLAIGIAVLGALFRAGIAGSLSPDIAHSGARALVATGQLRQAAALLGPAGGLTAARSAFANGFQLIVWCGAAINLAGSLVALLFVRMPAGQAVLPQPVATAAAPVR